MGRSLEKKNRKNKKKEIIEANADVSEFRREETVGRYTGNSSIALKNKYFK